MIVRLASPSAAKYSTGSVTLDRIVGHIRDAIRERAAMGLHGGRFDFSQVFRSIDRDGAGFLSLSSFREGLHRLGLTRGLSIQRARALARWFADSSAAVDANNEGDAASGGVALDGRGRVIGGNGGIGGGDVDYAQFIAFALHGSLAAPCADFGTSFAGMAADVLVLGKSVVTTVTSGRTTTMMTARPRQRRQRRRHKQFRALWRLKGFVEEAGARRGESFFDMCRQRDTNVHTNDSVTQGRMSFQDLERVVALITKRRFRREELVLVLELLDEDETGTEGTGPGSAAMSSSGAWWSTGGGGANDGGGDPDHTWGGVDYLHLLRRLASCPPIDGHAQQNPHLLNSSHASMTRSLHVSRGDGSDTGHRVWASSLARDRARQLHSSGATKLQRHYVGGTRRWMRQNKQKKRHNRSNGRHKLRWGGGDGGNSSGSGGDSVSDTDSDEQTGTLGARESVSRDLVPETEAEAEAGD